MCEQSGRAERRERILIWLLAVSAEPDMGFNPRNCEILTQAEIKSRTLNRLSHPGTPLFLSLNQFSLCPVGIDNSFQSEI